MLSVQKHGVCWGFSVATALVFAIIPASHYIFPTCFALLLIKRYKRYKKRDSDTEEHARLGPISEYFQTERDASPLTIGLYLLSLGALARMLCVYGPQGVVRWRQIIIFQTLLVFTFIGHEPDFARNVSMRAESPACGLISPSLLPRLPCHVIGPYLYQFHLTQDALDVPFPRIPTRNPLTYPFRRFYADTMFWAIVCFEIIIFDLILRLFCGAPGGMKDVFYPLNREVNIGHHIGYFCMLCPLFDSAETVSFLPLFLLVLLET